MFPQQGYVPRARPGQGSSQESTYQDSQDPSLSISSSSEPPAIRELDTLEIKLGESWERYVVHQVDQSGDAVAVCVTDLNEQTVSPNDLKEGVEVRRASVPASAAEKKVAVYARAEFIYKTMKNYTWEAPFHIGDYKIVHTYDAARSTPHDFRAYKSGAAKSGDYVCKGLKPLCESKGPPAEPVASSPRTLAENFFSGELLEKALQIARARPSFGPQPMGPGPVPVAPPPAPAPAAPAPPLTAEEVARFEAEAAEANEALVQHDHDERTEEAKFRDDVARVGSDELHALVEQYGQRSKRARETRGDLEKQCSEKRAKCDSRWEVNGQLLDAENAQRALKQKTAEAVRAAEEAKAAEAQGEDVIKGLRARAARYAVAQQV